MIKVRGQAPCLTETSPQLIRLALHCRQSREVRNPINYWRPVPRARELKIPPTSKHVEQPKQKFQFQSNACTRVAPNSEFDQIPNIFVHEEFPNTEYRKVFVNENFSNTEYRIVFVHENFSNTEYRIYLFMKNFRIPNTE